MRNSQKRQNVVGSKEDFRSEENEKIPSVKNTFAKIAKVLMAIEKTEKIL